ncbi:MAG: arylesterase [Proteobacteria bacterium]|nr:arylesterase [Pseudomonadota bacterium]
MINPLLAHGPLPSIICCLRANLAAVFLCLAFTQAASADSATRSSATRSIVVYGDSISAAYGIERDQGWVSLLEQRLAETHPNFRVINASVSGETTGGGVTRLAKTLEVHQPDILVLELGGNDGLRGYPIDRIRSNLEDMITRSMDAGVQVLLVGMVLPPNYGRRYTQAFEQTFAELAALSDLPVVPFLLEGTSTERSLIQGDGIHPTAEAQPRLLNDIWSKLEALL